MFELSVKFKKALKPKTLGDLLAWVKRCRRSHFQFRNDGEYGCLMTEHLRATRGVKGVVVGGGGVVQDERTGSMVLAEKVYPFHDRFWKPFIALKYNGFPHITRAQAIARLKEMIQEDRGN